jgi:hypothetical protein
MATIKHSLDDKPAGAFKTFPEFSKLTFADKETYEALIAQYPPIASISFTDLITWWNPLNSCAVSELNGNLVISYWLPGAEQQSGLSLLGTHNIDESLCVLFDYFSQRNEKPRVIRVPEFVLSQVQYPELFVSKEEREFGEYVYDISKFYPLNHLISYRRHRVRKFLSQISEDRITIKSLDLSSYNNQRLLLENDWPRTGINKIARVEDEAIETSIEHASLLGLENLCLYVDGVLRGYCLYYHPADKRYIIFKHAKVDYEIPRTLDYMIYAFAARYADKGVTYVNLDSDLGLPFLRMFKLALGPSNFFRKYTVEPVGR